MRILRVILPLLILICAADCFAQRSTPLIDVKKTAATLAKSWVEGASARTLDELANRSIAFAGMVPGLYVKIDGRRMNAGKALIDNALIIIKSNDNNADAAAIRNVVCILFEVANGRASKG